MKFLDRAFNKFVTSFDSEENEQEKERSPGMTSAFATGLSRRLKLAHDYRGLGTWEPCPDPFDPDQTIEVYVPALEEMSQKELGDIVSKRVAAAFRDKEPTVETERVKYAVYRIARFSYGSHRAGFIRQHDDLCKDVASVIGSCEVLVKFVEQEIENSADPVDDGELSVFLRATQYLTTMANRTYTSVIAQDSLINPDGNWRMAPSSLPCWPGLADLAGREAG